jgi:hypothetical protein
MKCPQCHFPNPPGTEFCHQCHQVLLHSATKGYLRNIHRERDRQERIDHQHKLRDKSIRKAQLHAAKHFVWKNSYWIPCALGLCVLIFGIVHYQSPLTRLRLYGTRLALIPPVGQSHYYLIGMDTQTDIRTERNGRMDVKLLSPHQSETGGAALKTAPGAATAKKITVQVAEWTRSVQHGESMKAHPVPAGHPSLAPVSVLTDSQGTLLERDVTDRMRLGRVVAAIFPQFPKGTLHPKQSWSEDVDWETGISGWKVRFKGTARWVIKNYEFRLGKPLVHLVYEAVVNPEVIGVPGWVKVSRSLIKETEPITVRGDALYDPKGKMLVSHSLNYAGTVWVGMDRLEDIPWEERPSDARLNGSGFIRLQLTDRFDLRKS